MTQVTADMVRELREMTGAPMMDTKRALVDADGDLEAAKQLLRERGMASAGKRAGNETPEGVVLTRLDDSKLGDELSMVPGSGRSFPRVRFLLLFLTDIAEHYNQLAGYMRLMGMVPPSAQPRPTR